MYAIITRFIEKDIEPANPRGTLQIIGVYHNHQEAIDKSKEIMGKFMEIEKLLGPVKQCGSFWSLENESKILTLGLLEDVRTVSFYGLIKNFNHRPRGYNNTEVDVFL